jgi:hypothetical protein
MSGISKKSKLICLVCDIVHEMLTSSYVCELTAENFNSNTGLQYFEEHVLSKFNGIMKRLETLFH